MTTQIPVVDREHRLSTLPTVVVVGAMKAATSAVHTYLDAHPQVAMSRPKELNFFNGTDTPPQDDPARWWQSGQWHRGVAWYAAQFDGRAPVRGESSPAYTSPCHPEVAARMSATLPDVRLVYVVREPFARAVSQLAHHRRDGSEGRPLEQALLDEQSQYLARSRYLARLRPFLKHFSRDQVHVVLQERLLRHRTQEMARVYENVGADPAAIDAGALTRRVNRGDTPPPSSRSLRARFRRRVEEDVEDLRDYLHDPLEEWHTD